MNRLLTAASCVLLVTSCQRPGPRGPAGMRVDFSKATAVESPLGTLHFDFELELVAEEQEEELPAEMAFAPEPRTGGAPSSPAAEVQGLGYLAGDDVQDLNAFLDQLDATSGTDEPRTWKPAGAPANATTLRVGDEEVLPLLGVEAGVWVEGYRARVLLDCIYENTYDQVLEGNFKLRLPEGASPYYLAFGEEVLRDDGSWELPRRDRSLSLGPEPERVALDREAHWKGAREARMVPRAEAAQAYRDTVRREVDPALLEWAGAGVFQTRVFPLAAGRVHRIVVGYEMDLVPVPASVGRYALDLDFPAELEALSLDLHVSSRNGAAVTVSPASTLPSQTVGGRATHSYPRTEERSFRVTLAGLEDVALVAEEDGGAFALDLVPDLGPAEVVSGGAPVAVFVVDTSLSSADGSYPIWLDLMERILDANRERLQRFCVLFFDVSARWWRPALAQNTEQAAAELRAFAESLALEGASDLGSALGEATRPGWLGGWDGPTWDLFLLSDGAATWGDSDLDALSLIARRGVVGPIFAYTTGRSGTDRRALEHLTRESDGGLFSVTGPADLERAATAHHSLPWTIEDVRLAGATDLLLRGRPRSLFAGQRLRLVGRGSPRAGDTIELALVRAGRRRDLSLPVAGTLSTPLAARAYGEVAVAQLEELGRATAQQAAAYATHYRVPGRACSLLMLESAEDYRAHGILSAEEVARSRAQAARPLIAAALDALAGVLEDPLRSLLERLEPLREAGALGESLGADWARGLALLDRRALTVQPEELLLEKPLASDVLPEIRAELAGGEPGYDVLQAEVARRMRELAKGDGVRLLSCLVELNPGDTVFARDVAQTLMQHGLFGHAYHLYLRVAEVRPFEPQSYLSLARCAEENGRPELALAWYRVSVQGAWDERFGDFRRIAAFDALHLLRRIGRGEVRSALDAALVRGMAEVLRSSAPDALDLAVAIQWNTDATDLDLHVLEPGGELCYYGSPETQNGGWLSADVTEGFGPELYVLPEAPNGEYTIYVHYFGESASRTSVRSKVLATVYERWGTDEEFLFRRELTLGEENEDHGIAWLVVDR